MGRRFMARLGAALALCAVLSGAVSAEQNGFIVTFRTGLEGASFTESYIRSVNGAANRERTAVSVVVTGDVLPAAPTAADVAVPGGSLYVPKGVVLVEQDTDYSDATPESLGRHTTDAVVEYAFVPGPRYRYTVEYRCRETGEELLNSRSWVLPEGEYELTAPEVPNFTPQNSRAVLTVTHKGGKLVFWYTKKVNYVDENVVVTLPGDTIYVYE